MMSFCECEQQVISAAKTGVLSESLRRHLATCDFCRESYQLATALGQVADETRAAMPPVPSADLVWLKAEFAAQRHDRTNLHLISAAVIGIMLLIAPIVYRMFSTVPAAYGPSALRLPVLGAPFPLDAGLIIFVLAIGLVLLLPAIGGKAPKKSPGTLMSF